MRPSRVRERVLADHVALRRQLGDLESCAQRTSEHPGGEAAELRSQAEALVTTLAEHMRWEDLYLAPALREADAWGLERAERLDCDHREQRELLSHVLSKLHDRERPPKLVVDTVLDLIRLLREDMQEEEELLLDPRVLRDDTVGIDVETG